MLKIVKGESRIFFVRLMNEDTKEPYDLTGVEVFEIAMKTQSGGVMKISSNDGLVSVIEPKNMGKIQVSLSQQDTNALADGEMQSFDVYLMNEENTRIVQLRNCLSVFPRL